VRIAGPWLEDATPVIVAQALKENLGFQAAKEFE